MSPYTAQCLDFVLHVMRQPTDAFGKNFPYFLDESGAVETPQVQFLDEIMSSSRSSTIPVFTQMLIPMVLFFQKTIEIPLFIDTGRLPCCAGHADSQVPLWRRHSCSHSCRSCRLCRGAEVVSHGPSCSADHRDSQVAVH